jgi:hypothetical protein
MATDTPATESNASLSVFEAANLFAAPEPEKKPEAQATESPEQAPELPEDTQADAEPETVEETDAEPEKVTIVVDGKTVELTKAELADHYKNGLRQADYTKKTMEAAEQRKAAEAATQQALEERQRYAQGLQQAQNVLQAQLSEQSRIDWKTLLETDPHEYLKQQALANSRQAELQKIAQAQQQLYARHQQEQAVQMHTYLQTQQEELLAKLPEWKDEAKATADKAAIKEYLKAQGLDDAQVGNITDHRVVVISRKAMLYDQMMSKAKAAAKQVQNLPQKVERPGSGETSPSDGRSVAMKRLAKSGSVLDAAKALEGFFK